MSSSEIPSKKRLRSPDAEEDEPDTRRTRAKTTDRQATAQRPPGIRERPSTSNLAAVSSKRHLEIASTKKRSELSTEEVYAVSQYAGLEKLKKTINALTILESGKRRARTPITEPTESDTPSDIRQLQQAQRLEDTLFTGQIVEGRDFNSKVEIRRGKQRPPVTRAIFSITKGTTERFVYRLTLNRQVDEAAAKKIGQEIAKAVNRFPGSIDLVSKASMPANMAPAFGGRLLADAAERRVLKTPLVLPGGYIQKENKQYAFPIVTLDPVTFAPARSGTFALSSKTLVDPAPPPPIHNVRFMKSGSRSDAVDPPLCEVTEGADGSVSHESALSDNDKAMYGKCEGVARAVQAKMWNRVISHSDAIKLTNHYLEEFGKNVNERLVTGTYGGKPLFYVGRSYAQRTTWLHPSKALSEDTTGRFPELVCHSLDRTRVLPAMDAANEVWLATGDAKKAWIAAAEKIQAANNDIAAGIKSTLTCLRAEGEPHCHVDHHCANCGKLGACKDLVVGLLGLPVHPKCDESLRRHFAGHGNVGLSFASTSKAMRGMILQENKDTHDLSFNDKRVQAILQECDEELRGLFADADSTTYNDGYRNKTCKTSAEGPGTFLGRDPFGPSVDAVFPYHLSGGGLIRKHCKDNIEVCALAINLAKHMQLPAFLHVVANHLITVEEFRKGEITQDIMDQQTAHIVRACAQLSGLRIKANFQHKYRLQHTPSHIRMTLDRQEWRTGMPAREHVSVEKNLPWEKPRLRGRPGKTTSKSWPSAEIARVKALLGMLETEFEVQLPQTDGCPWFCHPLTMPQGWGWPMCASMMASVYDRMKEQCGGLDIVDEDPIRCVIEIIFIVCVWCWEDKGGDKESGKFWTYEEKLAFRVEYAEFLDLPLVPFELNALCFAVAHKLHGHQMRTGWKENPTTLGDRTRDSSKQNMLLETQTSNYLKHNFETKTYPELKQAMREVTLGSMGPKDEKTGLGEWFDSKEKRIKSFPPDLADNLLEIDEQDGYDMEDAVADPLALEDFSTDADAVDDVEGEEGGLEQPPRTEDFLLDTLRLEGEGESKKFVDDTQQLALIAKLWTDYEETSSMVSDKYSKHMQLPVVTSVLEQLLDAAVNTDEEEYSRVKDKLTQLLSHPADLQQNRDTIAGLTADYDETTQQHPELVETDNASVLLEIMRDAAMAGNQGIYDDTKKELLAHMV